MTLHGAGFVPARLDADGWDTICASCHTHGMTVRVSSGIRQVMLQGRI